MFVFFNVTATTQFYTDGHTLSLHDALPILGPRRLPAISTQVLHLHVGWVARHPPRHHRPRPVGRPGDLRHGRADPPATTRCGWPSSEIGRASCRERVCQYV